MHQSTQDGRNAQEQKDGFIEVPRFPEHDRFLSEIESELSILNDKVLPAIRRAGLTEINAKIMFQVAERPASICQDGSLAPTTFRHREFITYTGRRAALNRLAFENYYSQTKEGEQRAAFWRSLSKSDREGLRHFRDLDA